MPQPSNFGDFYEENKSLVNDYLETRINLIKLQSLRSLSRILSVLIILFITSSLLLFILLFLGMSFAWWIAALTESNTIGFLSAAGLFLVLAVVVIIFRKPMFQGPLVRLFIRETVSEWQEQEEVD